MSLIPIKLLCNRRPKSSSGSGSGSSSSGSGTTTNSAALPDWFYFNTEENSVHCKYPLVGDSEVSAFGYGSSSGSGGGGGGEIDPSYLENYVTKDYLSQQGYLSSADMSNYVTYSYLDEKDYDEAITQLNSSMSGLAAQVQTNKSYLTAYNTRISALEDKVDELDTYNLNDRLIYVEDTVGDISNNYYDLDDSVSSLRQKMNSYILSYVPMIERLYAYFPILAYMELGRDLNSNGTTYIKFKCPIVSTGDIGAFEIG